jgi:hypothetical protein
MEMAVDGDSGNGIFAAVINDNNGMVAEASAAAAQLAMMTTIPSTTISQRGYCCGCHCVPFIPLPPPSTRATINKDHHHLGRYRLMLPLTMTAIAAVDNKQQPLASGSPHC